MQFLYEGLVFLTTLERAGWERNENNENKSLVFSFTHELSSTMDNLEIGYILIT